MLRLGMSKTINPVPLYAAVLQRMQGKQQNRPGIFQRRETENKPLKKKNL
jgi:hypothetical protein